MRAGIAFKAVGCIVAALLLLGTTPRGVEEASRRSEAAAPPAEAVPDAAEIAARQYSPYVVQPIPCEEMLALWAEVQEHGFSNPEEQIALILDAARFAFEADIQDWEVVRQAMRVLEFAAPEQREDVRRLAADVARMPLPRGAESQRHNAVRAAAVVLAKDASPEAVAVLFDVALAGMPPEDSYFALPEVRQRVDDDDWMHTASHTGIRSYMFLPTKQAISFLNLVKAHYEEHGLVRRARWFSPEEAAPWLRYIDDCIERAEVSLADGHTGPTASLPTLNLAAMKECQEQEKNTAAEAKQAPPEAVNAEHAVSQPEPQVEAISAAREAKLDAAVPPLVEQAQVGLEAAPADWEAVKDAMWALRKLLAHGREDVRELSAAVLQQPLKATRGLEPSRANAAHYAAFQLSLEMLAADDSEPARDALRASALAAVASEKAPYGAHEVEQEDLLFRSLWTLGAAKFIQPPEEAAGFVQAVVDRYAASEHGGDEELMHLFQQPLEYALAALDGKPPRRRIPRSAPFTASVFVQAPVGLALPLAPPLGLHKADVLSYYRTYEPERLYIVQAELAELDSVRACFRLGPDRTMKAEEGVARGEAWLEAHPDHLLAPALRQLLTGQIASLSTEALGMSLPERRACIERLYASAQMADAPLCQAWFDTTHRWAQALETLAYKQSRVRIRQVYADLDQRFGPQEEMESDELAHERQALWMTLVAENLRAENEALEQALAAWEWYGQRARELARNIWLAPYGDLGPAEAADIVGKAELATSNLRSRMVRNEDSIQEYQQRSGYRLE